MLKDAGRDRWHVGHALVRGEYAPRKRVFKQVLGWCGWVGDSEKVRSQREIVVVVVTCVCADKGAPEIK